MNTLGNENDVSDAGGKNTHREMPSRRTIAKGSAWSIPVVTMAAAAPASASSALVTYVFSVTGSGTNQTQCQFVLPPTAQGITYEVEGGNGGRGRGPASGAPGGRAANLTGTLTAPPAGLTLTLVAGGYGAPGPTTASTAPTAGGTGWGNGGSSPTGTADSINGRAYGGGGGAGSAIAIAGTALVVAGGGGGSGALVGVTQSTGPQPGAGLTLGHGGFGGMSGVTAENALTILQASTTSTTIAHHIIMGYGGRGATTTAGAGGPLAGVVVIGATGTITRIAGNAGTTGSITGGGNGGNGVTITHSPGPLFVVRRATSGGGGGGYSGGGSGSASTWIRSTNPETHTAHSAGGGGGSSYVAPGSVAGITASNASVAPGGDPGNAFTPSPGKVIITFQAPPGLNLAGCGTVI